MLKRNQIYTAMLAVTLTSLSAASMAQETTTANVGVTVSNAFSLAETTPLDLGTFLVKYVKTGAIGTTDFGTPASIRFNADGTYETPVDGIPDAANSATDEATLTLISPGTPGVFAISGAAPNTSMQLTFPASTNLPKIGQATTFFTLAVDDSGTGDDILVLDGPAAGQSFTTNNLITDATGAVSFAYGGTLAIPGTAPAAAGSPIFTDGTYSATFDVTVSY